LHLLLSKMSLSSYLANKYLTASSSAHAKKRKRKTPSNATGLVIADDDDLGWSKTPTEQDSDEDSPQTIASGSAEFRRAKKSSWKTVGAPVIQPKDSEQDEADRIIKEAAEEGRGMEDDDAQVVEENEGVVKMGDGTHAGLQSAAAVAAQFAKRKKEEAEAWERESGSKKGKKGAAEETVYRDATGRRIDISFRRAEARRELDEKTRKEREALEEQKGDVQRLQQQKRREELDEARFIPLARTVDDEEMNAELKEKERWNDPAAQFLASKKATKSRTGKPIYKGSWAPNRYGIAPGHKWDGVDRGNGWEAERFKASNRVTRNKDLDFAWQMDE
jgi:pre-mRNA-splicing factor CWC26